MYDCPVQCAFLTHKFTGLERDSESNLDHTWFRQYSSPIGRWMRPDPAGLAAVDPFNPQSWNRYVYVLNNPLAYRDALGLECVWDDGSYDSMSDSESGDPGTCGDLGGTWIDHSFFSDFGLADWSASGDLAGIVSALEAGFALVQTGSGLGGWMLVANGGAGPIDWSLLGPQVPTLTYSQQLLGAAAKGANQAAHVIPVPCGGGVFGYFGAEKEGTAEGFAGVLVEYDSQAGASVSWLLEAATAGGTGGGAVIEKNGVTPLAFIPLAGEGGVVLFKDGVGVYAGDAKGHVGYGAGTYAHITSAAGCN